MIGLEHRAPPASFFSCSDLPSLCFSEKRQRTHEVHLVINIKIRGVMASDDTHTLGTHPTLHIGVLTPCPPGGVAQPRLADRDATEAD